MKKNVNWKLYLGSLVVIFLWLLSFPIIKYFSDSNDWTKIGVFGDSFGAINSLFSGLAFVGLIFTIYLQKNELRLQREELKLQRNELKENREQLRRSAEAQEKTEILLEKQLLVDSRSAKINALTTIIENYNSEIRLYPRDKYVIKKRDEILKLLDLQVTAINRILDKTKN
jgi:hypothetical protein